ncbi:diphthine--ammonia ligase [Sergentomyia squamirostris]
MRVVGLISGGKDSIYNLMQCKLEGHELVALANLYPNDDREEMDSYMFQTVGYSGIEMIATALDLPLYRRKTSGTSQKIEQEYLFTPDDPADEVEDLYDLLQEVKTVHNIDAVASGAILSNYQRCRVENVCNRLHLTSLSYLWRRNQSELLQEMIDSGMEAILIKVATLGLTPEKHLGKTIREIQPEMIKLNNMYGVNICGEGGEYETFTLDCPLFKYRISVADKRIVSASNDVGYIVFEKLALEKKGAESPNLNRVKKFYNSLDYANYSTREILEKTRLDFEHPAPVVKDHSGLIEWIWLPRISGKGKDSVEAAKDAMVQLEKSARDLKISMKDILFINIFVKSMKDFAKINAIYSSVLNFANPPARACVETQLPDNTWILLEAFAAIVGDNIPKDCLHIQGISHWAPSNIGPYSQGKRLGRTAIVSGQIGLIPGSMSLPPNENFLTEFKLSLRNTDCVIKSLDPPSNITNVSLAICYLTDSILIPQAALETENIFSNAIVNFVVVSALPRNAQVEFQVLLHSPERPREKQEFTYNDDNLILRIQKLSNESDDFGIVSGTITPNCELLSENIQEALINFLNKITEVVYSQTDNKADHCRIFYNINHVKIIKTVLEDYFKKLNVDFVLIPAVDLVDNGIVTVTFIKLG